MKRSLTFCSAVKQVLDGVISEKGILAPMTPEINNPLIKELKEKYGYVLFIVTLSKSLA